MELRRGRGGGGGGVVGVVRAVLTSAARWRPGWPRVTGLVFWRWGFKVAPVLAWFTAVASAADMVMNGVSGLHHGGPSPANA